MNKKKCKECKHPFTPTRQLQPVCEKIECQIAYTNKHLSNKSKEKKQVARKALKSFNATDKNILKELAQKIFNQYIRERDKDLACISCGTRNNIQYHAGHYKPAGGFSYLRFNENNTHKQCVRCNMNLSGNLIPYRAALIKKIGIDEVERLEQPNQIKSWTVEEYQEIITIYRKKLKEFSNN